MRAMPVRRPAGAVTLAIVAAVALPASASAQAPAARGTALSPDRTTVNARSTPGGRVQARVRHGQRLRITCQRPGPVASARGQRSNIWNRVVVGSQRLYISDTLMRTGPAGVLVAKLCGAPVPRAVTPGTLDGACGIVSPVDQRAPFASRREFVAAAVPGAQASARETRVPASVTLGQAILETGSGRIAAGANNYFGIKAQAVSGTRAGTYTWGAEAVGCVLRKTQEVIKGRSVTTIGAFRAYPSLDESIRDHGARLLANPVYRGAFDHLDDPEAFARSIARHYATDPRYADKVIGLMRGEKLTRYDVDPASPPASTAPAAPPADPPPASAGGGAAAP